MTTTMTKELLLSILAMDAYNRGDGAGIELTGTQIGTAILQGPADGMPSDPVARQAWIDAGFYAAAYSTQYGTVISYRGTDNPDFLGTESGASDFWNGWKDHIPEIWPAG